MISKKLIILAFESLIGISLKNFVNQNTISVVQKLKIFKNILLTLKTVHENKIAHRGLTIDNILISSDLRTTFINFGMAKSYCSQKTVSKCLRKGNTFYLGPENFGDSQINCEIDFKF